MKLTWFGRLTQHDILIATLISLIVFVLPVFRMYFVNVRGLIVSFETVMLVCLVSVLLTVAVVMLALKYSPFQWRARILLGLMACVGLVWLYSNISQWQLGLFNGEEKRFADHWAKVATELLASAILIGAIFYYRDVCVRNARLIFGFMAVSALLSLVQPLQTYLNRNPVMEVHKKHMLAQHRQLFEFSEQENVIVFVLDTFQTDAVFKLFRDRPELSDEFDGFTFFSDNITPFNYTQLSIPAILTGQMYGNKQTMYDYLENAYYSSKSVPYRLKQAGYDSRSTSFYWLSYLPDSRLWDNVVETERSEEDISSLMRLWLYNVSPLFIKVRLFHQISFVTQRGLRKKKILAECGRGLKISDMPEGQGYDFRILKAFLDCGNVAFKENVFRLYHLTGAHPPFALAKMSEDAPKDRNALFMRQLEISLDMVRLMLEHLKKIGAYDNSLIMLVGDHGLHDYHVDTSVFATSIENLVPRQRNQTNDLQAINEALGLLMVKRKAERGNLKIIDAPVQATDIPATIFSEMGVDVDGSGPSLFDVDSGESRVRTHRHYEPWGSSPFYVSDLKEYQIKGPGWDLNSWQVPPTPLPPP